MTTVQADCLGTHRKGDGSSWLNDARGIAVARVCERCEPIVKGGYRPDVFEDSNYWTDEPVNAD